MVLIRKQHFIKQCSSNPKEILLLGIFSPVATPFILNWRYPLEPSVKQYESL
jgi:hypothetical protein